MIPKTRTEIKYNFPIKKRDKIDIMHTILTLISQGPIKPTHIIQGTYLQYNRAVKIISNLVDKGFVTEYKYHTTGKTKKIRKAYSLTQEGFLLLEKLDEILEILGGIY